MSGVALRNNDTEKWVDYLVAHNYDVNNIYRALVSRINGNPGYVKNLIAEKKKAQASLPAIKAYLEGVSEYDKTDEILKRLQSKLTRIP